MNSHQQPGYIASQMEPSKLLPNSVGQAIISNSVSFLSLMQCIGENCTCVTALACLEYPHIIHADEDGHPGPNYRYIPSEKIGQNVHPSESFFLSLLGTYGIANMDVFLEKFQTAFDPPPSPFLEITLRFFCENS